MATILVKPDGDKVIILAANANDAWGDHAEEIGRDLDHASSGSVLVADLEVPAEVVRAAIHADGRRQACVLDPSPTERVDDDLLVEVDHITPNHREAPQLTGRDTSSPDGAMAAVETLLARGVGAAYVKLESGGCAVAAGEARALVAAPPDITVADKTGAGDAFAGGLAWALLTRKEPVAAAVVAVAAASCAVTRYGSQASYPSSIELSEMMGRVEQARFGG